MAEIPPPSAMPDALHAAARPQTGALVSAALVIVSVIFAVGGQLVLKTAMREIGRIGGAEFLAAGETISRALREPRLWIGLALFGVSALFWMVVLSRVPLSVAYPFVGISYVLIVASSRFILHEQVPALRWVGVLVVAIGIAIVGLSFRGVTNQ